MGCVRAEHEVPVTSEPGDTAAVRPTLDAAVGCDVLSQSVVEFGPGRSLPRDTGDCEEVLFVLSGEGELLLDGSSYRLEPEAGAYLAPGETYEVLNERNEPLKVVRVSVPHPPEPSGEEGEREVVRRLADQTAQDATTDRQFRVVADPDSGLRSATHFVGYIPTARAPDHFHYYDEVIYVLEGEGAMHMDGESTPLSPGSCIHLPARTVHCLENQGEDLMKVVAVFRPAGSPAAAYYPDGTPAYQGAASE
jgi:mannose-6-phosphate isomerase-like protein (cupin superfamily)